MRASALLAGFLASAALSACNKKASEEATKAPPPPPVKVQLEKVTEAEAPELLTLTGLLTADQRSEVTADTQGKVIAVMIERGQEVKMGDPVVRLDVRSASLSAREAQANLAAARAQKNLAEEECKRAQSLLDKGAITRSEYDRQSTQCTSALQQVSAAQARTEMISKSVADGLVRAPFDGIIADKNVTAGEWVAPGRPLFTLVDSDPLKIELSVPEKAIRAIALKQPVIVTAVANPCYRYNAIVTRVGAEIGRTRSMIVEATVDATKPELIDAPECKETAQQIKTKLVPGMFAEAQVTIDRVKRPIVPIDAVDKRGKQMHVFVAVNGEVEDRIVQVGSSPSPGKVAIVRGLKVNDMVVRNARGNPAIVDGLRIEGGK
ncbi:MAG: efflux RND transporter periplasmic adaptor subunit [Deltaproteobacteria bacterium]|nr:efflux RND transporter periplasmic adaptor subunit [Deltaproteobacteria bacterium]